ncbi:MAG: acetylglutamate kinase [bacterium]|nr:acetylglutamate kinase [bacterium]
MKQLIEKANVLMEALPYIKKFYGKTIVIKYGGSAMTNESLKRSVCMDIILMKYIGISPVIVHGGGKEISELMVKLGKQPKFVNGQRVTDAETVKIVEMVLSGSINKELVGFINSNGGNAVGLSGKDGNLIISKRLSKNSGDFIGGVKKINPEVINLLDEKGFIPVISSVGLGEDGLTYNINADLAAGEIAAAVNAEKLILLTDTPGVLDKNGNLIPHLDQAKIKKLIKAGVIQGGMMPKIAAGLKALNAGVKKVHIIDGKIEHSILLEIMTDKGVGTEIV